MGEKEMRRKKGEKAFFVLLLSDQVPRISEEGKTKVVVFFSSWWRKRVHTAPLGRTRLSKEPEEFRRRPHSRSASMAAARPGILKTNPRANPTTSEFTTTTPAS
jgi:hypothetical protein